MQLRIYQLNQERASQGPILMETGTSHPTANAALYDEVFRGEGDWKDIQEAVDQFRLGEGHPVFRGRDIQPTDVFVTEQGAFFQGWEGLTKVAFDTDQAQKQEGLLRVLYVEPNRPPFETEIESDIHSLQKAVKGLIEPIYLGDNCILVGNEEAKLIGMEGNRRLDSGSVIAGPFFLVGDGGENFVSLTDRQVEQYMQRFAQPEQISRAEVEADMGWTFISF